MFCLGCKPNTKDNEYTKKEPVVDLVKVLEKLAWDKLKRNPPAALNLCEQYVCDLQKLLVVEVDTTRIRLTHPDSLTIYPKQTGSTRNGEETDEPEGSEGNDGSAGAPHPGNRGPQRVQLELESLQAGPSLVLFQSYYKNETEHNQSYSFKTERQTKSMVEISMQRGFTMGQTLELDVKIPTGVKGCKVSGKLGGQMQWSFSRGKVSRKEEQVTWSVDSHVQVGGNKTGTASLEVQEMRWDAKYSLKCVISPCPMEDSDEDGKNNGETASQAPLQEGTGAPDEAGSLTVPFAVFVRRRTTGQLIKILTFGRQTIIKARPHHFEALKDDETKSGIVCTIEGQCSSVCAINQTVSIKE